MSLLLYLCQHFYSIDSIECILQYLIENDQAFSCKFFCIGTFSITMACHSRRKNREHTLLIFLSSINFQSYLCSLYSLSACPDTVVSNLSKSPGHGSRSMIWVRVYNSFLCQYSAASLSDASEIQDLDSSIPGARAANPLVVNNRSLPAQVVHFPKVYALIVFFVDGFVTLIGASQGLSSRGSKKAAGTLA